MEEPQRLKDETGRGLRHSIRFLRVFNGFWLVQWLGLKWNLWNLLV